MRPTTLPTNYCWILLTLLFGLILTILPVSHQIVWFWPQWLFAILLFWVIHAPSQCGVGMAFVVGLCADLVTGTCLGQHALAFVVLIYFVLKTQGPILYAPLLQQASIVGLFALLNVLIQGLLLHMTGHTTHDWLNFLAVLTTCLIWPFVSVALNKLRPRALIR